LSVLTLSKTHMPLGAEYLRRVRDYAPDVHPGDLQSAMLRVLDLNFERSAMQDLATLLSIGVDPSFHRLRLSTQPSFRCPRHKRYHVGSHRHMRFGKVVADALRLSHPVWGALLCPTGALNASNPLQFVELHNVVTDAYRYLHLFHGRLPAYNYAGGSDNQAVATTKGLWVCMTLGKSGR
jgi:hypothetical protein